MHPVGLLFVLHPHLNGWRWAIMTATVDELLNEPSQRCVNAGREETREAADTFGQSSLYTLLSFAQRVGVQVNVSVVSLDADPFPHPMAANPGDAVQVTPQLLQIGG